MPTNEKWFNQGNGQFTNVAVGANADGRLEVFTYEIPGAGRVFHKWQPKINEGPWSDWAPFPAVLNEYTYFNNFHAGHTDLFVGLSGEGSSCLRVVTVGGWSIAQTAENNGWGAWKEIHSGSPPERLQVSSVARSFDGRLYVFGVDLATAKVVYSNSNKAGTEWSDWQDLGLLSGAPFAVRVDDWNVRSAFARRKAKNQAVGANADGRMEIFAGQTSMVHRWQTDRLQQDSWHDWSALGAPPSQIDGMNDYAVIQNEDGRLELFAVTDEGNLLRLWHTWQDNPNGSWGAWAERPGLLLRPIRPVNSTGSRKGPFRTARSADGRLMIFAIGEDGGIHYNMQKDPNGKSGWEPEWHPLEGERITAFDVGQNLNGRLEVFIVSAGSVLHRWQLPLKLTGQQLGQLPEQNRWSVG